jgi:CTP synthase
MAVIEYCRNVLNIPEANSEEFVPSPHKPYYSAIVFMPEGSKEIMGGTMRLGSRTTYIRDGTLAQILYGGNSVAERHRHRYEVNPALVSDLESKGMIFSGRDGTGQRMEIIELPMDKHPYFIGVQFHPEYKSRPLRPAPVFLGLLQAARNYRKTKSNINLKQ